MLASGAIVRAAALPHLAAAFASTEGGLRVIDALADVINRVRGCFVLLLLLGRACPCGTLFIPRPSLLSRDAQYDAAVAKNAGTDFPVDVVRSAVRAIDAVVRAAPSLLVAHRRVASYIAFLES